MFGRDVRLVVPLFQRAYVWNEEKQWAPLWQDVLATYERSADDDPAAHFLGAVVLQLRPGALGAIEQREIIDGQQRLTTLQLLIAAVSDAFTRRGLDTKASRRLRRLIANDPDAVDDEADIHKLWPTNRDRSGYVEVMDGRLLEANVGEVEGQIRRGYLWFRDAVDAWLVDVGEDDHEVALSRLAEVISDLLELVVIDLGEQDDAQMIFETLNARGTPLRASDLIKNLIFRTLQDSGRPVDRLYEKYWKPLEDPYWEQGDRIGRLVRERLDVFMGHFLVVLLNAEVQSHSLFDAARRYVSGDAHRAESLLIEIDRYAAIFRSVQDRQVGDDTLATGLERLAIADTQTLQPLLLWLFAHAEGDDRRQAVLALESYVVRRVMCRMTPKNYNRMFLELLRRLSEDDAPVGKVVEEFLAAQRAESAVWPTDADVRRAVTTFPLYRLLRRDQVQRILRILDAEAAGPKSERLVVQGSLSVEHLMPQSWREHWPLPLDENAAAREEETRAELLHTFGNLTVLTSALNSSLSNGSWSTKRHEILRHSALHLNRELPGDWGTARIVERGERLADLAVRVWPRPASDQPESSWLPEGPDGEEKPLRRGGGPRGDIAAHIVEVFAGLPAGSFMTISQISKCSSAAYPDGPPSQGAISARLFPRDGRPSTVPGVRPDTERGVRGARRL
ncbi:DUF262 domain-containing protein [Cellulomonas sp. PSBB021]|uniref:DUF262 domain-containing protein n=1 Tax=Cellulomonas sp. PSBB021 TaxID=2003551 RepID=UPI0018DF407C|nr:DUF262 domain-containing protein [Cellulomonas sp. PSBB021]